MRFSVSGMVLNVGCCRRFESFILYYKEKKMERKIYKNQVLELCFFEDIFILNREEDRHGKYILDLVSGRF